MMWDVCVVHGVYVCMWCMVWEPGVVHGMHVHMVCRHCVCVEGGGVVHGECVCVWGGMCSAWCGIGIVHTWCVCGALGVGVVVHSIHVVLVAVGVDRN